MTEYKIKLIPSSSFLQFKRDRESGNQIKLTGLEVDYITSNRTPLTSSTTPAQVENEFRLVSGSFNDIIRETGDIVTAYRIDRDYYKLEFINRFYNKSFVGFLIKYKASGVSNYVPAFLSKELTGGKLFTERSVAKICIYANIPDAVMEGYYTPTVDVSKFLLPEDRATITYDDEQLTTIVTLDTYLDTVAQNLPAYRNGTYFEDSNKLVHMKVLGGNPYDYRGIMEKMMATFTSSIKSFGNVVDHLNSTNSRDALAATQGRVLNLKKLDIGDFSDWSTVNQNDIPIFRRTNGTVVTPKSLREFYEVLMEVLDNRSITRIYTINNFSDTTVTIPHNLGSKWHGISSITNAFVSEDDSKWKEIPETAINVTVDATNIIATIDKSKLPAIFKDTTDEPNSKLYNANSEKRGRITIIIDKNAVALAGIPPLLKMDKLVIGRRTTDPNKNVTLTGTIRFSSGTLKEKLVVTGATAVGAPRFTQDTQNPKIYHIEQDIEAKDNETMEVKVQGFADYNGEELPSNVVTTEVTLKRILKPEILDVSHTINLNYDSQNNNYEMTITPNTLYVGAHLKFTPSHVKFTTVPKELKEMLQVNKAYPVGTPIKMRISSLVDLKKLSGDHAIRLVGVYTDQTGFDSNSWSDPYTTNINLKDLFKSISWEDSSSVEDKYINYTKAYKEYKAYPTAPVLYELKPKVQGAVDKSKIQYSIVNLPADSQKFAPFITIEGDKVKVDYVGLAAQLNNAKDIEEIRFDVRARAKDAQGGDVYYNNVPLLAIKSFKLKIHSNAVLVLSVMNFLQGAGLIQKHTEKSALQIVNSTNPTVNNKFVYDLTLGDANTTFSSQNAYVMGIPTAGGVLNNGAFLNSNFIKKFEDENDVFKAVLSYDDSIDPHNLIKTVGIEIMPEDGSDTWKQYMPPEVPWELRYPSSGFGKLEAGGMEWIPFIAKRSGAKAFLIRGKYNVEVNGVKYQKYTETIKIDLSELRDFRYSLSIMNDFKLNYLPDSSDKFRFISKTSENENSRIEPSRYVFNNAHLNATMAMDIEFKPIGAESIAKAQDGKLEGITLVSSNSLNGSVSARNSIPSISEQTVIGTGRISRTVLTKNEQSGIYSGRIESNALGINNKLLYYIAIPWLLRGGTAYSGINGKIRFTLTNIVTKEKISSSWNWMLGGINSFDEFLDFAVEAGEVPLTTFEMSREVRQAYGQQTSYFSEEGGGRNDFGVAQREITVRTPDHPSPFDLHLINNYYKTRDLSETFLGKFLRVNSQTNKLEKIASASSIIGNTCAVLYPGFKHEIHNEERVDEWGHRRLVSKDIVLVATKAEYSTWKMQSTKYNNFAKPAMKIYVVNADGSYSGIGDPTSNTGDLNWPICGNPNGKYTFASSSVSENGTQYELPDD